MHQIVYTPDDIARFLDGQKLEDYMLDWIKANIHVHGSNVNAAYIDSMHSLFALQVVIWKLLGENREHTKQFIMDMIGVYNTYIQSTRNPEEKLPDVKEMLKNSLLKNLGGET